jgi:hypothetical protein
VADSGISRTVAQPPLERSAQTLPVPLGGLTPVHRRSSGLRRAAGAHRSVPMVALALLFVAGGVWLSTSPRAFQAGQDSAGVHVDGITLTRVVSSTARSQVFTGAATLVIDMESSGVVTAAAVMTWNGLAATGRCVLRRTIADVVETCVYALGSNRLASSDRFSPRTRTWYREYSDGVAVNITVPRGSTVIPVPFPLGR